MYSNLNCILFTRKSLRKECILVDRLKKIFYIKELLIYLKKLNNHTGMLLFGARRTRKSISILQEIKDLNVDYNIYSLKIDVIK